MIETLKIKALDTLAAAHLNNQRGANPANLLHGPKRQRIYTAINMADRIRPGTSQWVAEFVTHTESFPFGQVDGIAFAEGGENIIFLVRGNHEQLVVKVNKQSIGASQKELMRIAGQIKEDLDTIHGWYPDIPDFVPPETTVILHSHIRRLPAVATVQQYIPEPWYDIFADFQTRDLCEFLSKQQQLRGHFIHFAEQTVNIFHNTGQCVDLLGPNNVSFVNRNGTSLNLTDPHLIFDGPFIAALPENMQSDLSSKISYLENIANEV